MQVREQGKKGRGHQKANGEGPAPGSNPEERGVDFVPSSVLDYLAYYHPNSSNCVGIQLHHY